MRRHPPRIIVPVLVALFTLDAAVPTIGAGGKMDRGFPPPSWVQVSVECAVPGFVSPTPAAGPADPACAAARALAGGPPPAIGTWRTPAPESLGKLLGFQGRLGVHLRAWPEWDEANPARSVGDVLSGLDVAYLAERPEIAPHKGVPPMARLLGGLLPRFGPAWSCGDEAAAQPCDANGSVFHSWAAAVGAAAEGRSERQVLVLETRPDGVGGFPVEGVSSWVHLGGTLLILGSGASTAALLEGVGGPDMGAHEALVGVDPGHPILWHPNRLGDFPDLFGPVGFDLSDLGGFSVLVGTRSAAQLAVSRDGAVGAGRVLLASIAGGAAPSAACVERSNRADAGCLPADLLENLFVWSLPGSHDWGQAFPLEAGWARVQGVVDLPGDGIGERQRLALSIDVFDVGVEGGFQDENTA